MQLEDLKWAGDCMGVIESKINECLQEFEIDSIQLKRIADVFCQEIERGLKKEKSSFKMLKSYLQLPNGEEKGHYLALDFGGTNLRILLIALLGQGRFKVIKKVTAPLITESYNYITNNVCAEELFDFIAELIRKVTDDEYRYFLGHTFSFPSEQSALNHARLIVWTKEFAVQGVEGKDVNALLSDALIRKGRSNIIPVAVINDTVATILAAAYKDDCVHIGSICGTGHNTAYLESYDGKRCPMIINLESGNFSHLRLNTFDKILDQQSEKKGEQVFEKMVAGKYLGRLLVLVLKELGMLKQEIVLTSKDLSEIIQDSSPNYRKTKEIFFAQIEDTFTEMEYSYIVEIAKRIIRRSARLVTAGYIGIIQHMDFNFNNKHHIAIDGSLYEKMPGYAQLIQKTFVELLGDEKAKNIKVILENQGSGIGGAIAAAIFNEGRLDSDRIIMPSES